MNMSSIYTHIIILYICIGLSYTAHTHAFYKLINIYICITVSVKLRVAYLRISSDSDIEKKHTRSNPYTVWSSVVFGDNGPLDN